WKIALLGTATVNGAPAWVSSQLAPLAIAEPFLTMKIEMASTQPGQPARVFCILEQKVPFEGKATIKLLGLPEKVIAPEMQITGQDQEVVFPVKVDPSCPTGSHKNLFCVVAVHKDGEIIPHNVGQGGVLRIVPQKTPVVARAEKIAAKNLGGNQ
ncbi:MAG TPA: hypothetical protein VEO53_18560, partial [Candidatus Binatia bacterium]|nr:hypothetical protein [Candidatus Binatia bacterium]